MRAAAALITLTLLATVLTGCLGGDPGPVTPQETDGLTGPQRPRVVVADVDTGINPYHVAFRDNSSEAYLHPSTYLAGYPVDAPALNLTLDAKDYETAVRADCAEWATVETGKLYWIPGTRIVGAITFEDNAKECTEEALPGAILDRQGHGTMTASRVAGATTSLCPECKIVFIQGFASASMAWAADQPYIDLQTNSWGALPTDYGAAEASGLGGNDRAEVMTAAGKHPIFVAGGNGLLGFFGVTGHPAYLDDIAGPNGIIMVGGHDGGRFTPWTMTLPHVVADANWHPAAEHESLDGGDDRTGGGTSGATPFAAGTFARMILEGRLLVNDTGTGVRGGALVVAAANATLPAEGPLADGLLTVAEAKVLYFHTANPRPVRDGERDGDTCSPEKNPVGCTLYATTPIEWGMIPEAVPAYYFVGYGQVGEVTLNGTLAALRGETPTPARPVEDQFYGFDTSAREAFDEQGSR